MNETVSISQFAKALASQTSYKEDFCEQFVLELFKAAEEALKEQSSVKIKGIGEFRMSEEGGRVLFSPDPELADAVNEPFSCFEPEELDDDITEEILDMGSDEAEAPDNTTDDIDDKATNEGKTDGPMPPSEEAEIQENATESDIRAAQEQTAEETNCETETPLQATAYTPADGQPNDPADDIPAETNDRQNGRRLKRRLITVAAVSFIIGLLAGAAAGIFIIRNLSKTSPSHALPYISEEGQQHETEIQPTDVTKQEQPEKNDIEEPSTDDIVTETVTSTNYLATIARRHYGRYEFWVYIYEENKGILGHPDRIAPNTVVIVPPADKYGIDPENPESVNLALKKSEEIYSNFSN